MLDITITTLHGLEPVLAREIAQLGGQNVMILKRAVTFSGSKRTLYRCLYELRTALRVFLPFHQFKTKHENHLYKKIREVEWSDWMSLDDTFLIHAVTQSRYLTHSKYVALKIKDAIVDQFRDQFGRRPSIDKKNPVHRLSVHISRDNLCTLSWDLSGAPLNQRGYRQATGEAPVNEVLAAGILLWTDWQRNCDFIDPMCGSGTFLIEAAFYAHRIPPQFFREQFAVEQHPDFDAKLWEQVKDAANANIQEFDHQIMGFDKDMQAVEAARINLAKAHLDEDVVVERSDIKNLKKPANKGLLVMNPPYDERLSLADARAFYSELGDCLKHQFSGWDAWIISGNIRAMRQIGLRPSRKKILFNGPIECQLAHYELYRGSKESSK